MNVEGRPRGPAFVNFATASTARRHRAGAFPCPHYRRDAAASHAVPWVNPITQDE